MNFWLIQNNFVFVLLLSLDVNRGIILNTASVS